MTAGIQQDAPSLPVTTGSESEPAAPAPRVLVSVTSIPRRFSSSLVEVLRVLRTSGFPVLVCLPREYRKWGAVELPPSLQDAQDVTVFRPSQDYGPATKLLGALEYLKVSGREVDAIITMDDDMYYSDPRGHIEYLLEQARAHPGCVVTIGGIKLLHPPFTRGNGLRYGNVGYVDVVAGFRGVLYPAALFRQDDSAFSLMTSLPSGIFHDDDLYFGIVASVMGVPIYAAPEFTRNAAGEEVQLRSLEEAAFSGVQDQAGKDRLVNERELFEFAVQRGLLPNRRTGLNRAQRLLARVRHRAAQVARRVLR